MPAHPTAKSITPGSRVQSGPVNTNYVAINQDLIDHIDGTNYRHPATAIDVAQRDESEPVVNVAGTSQTVANMYAAIFSRILGPWQNVSGTAGVGYAQRYANLSSGASLYDVYAQLGTIAANGWVTSARVQDASLVGGDLVAGTITTRELADLGIQTGDIADGAITSAKIADATIQTADLADNSVTSAKLAPGAVTLSDIADGTITAVKIATDTITAGQIAADAITASELADNAVDAAAIAAGAVTTAKILDGAVTSAKIADGTILGTDVAAGTITSANIQDGTIATADIGASQITSALIADGTIVGADIAAGTITSANILDGTIVTADLADNSVTTAKHADASVTTAKIADGAVTTAKVADASVTTAKVADYAVSGRKLLEGAVTPTSPPSMRVWTNTVKKFDGFGNAVEWGGDYLDLSSYVPGSGTSVWVLVYLNATASVLASAGQASGTPQKPQAIGGQTPLAFVLLYAGMMAITETDIYEWRVHVAPFAVGGGTGSGFSPQGHRHGEGYESFIGIAAVDEGRVGVPSVAGMTVYVQPTRYSDTSGATQQFPGGPSPVIARPVSNPYLVAVGLSQTGAITLNYGAEAATPVRGAFLNPTDIPLAYILVRPASTRTIANDDLVNALILDARRPYTVSSAAAGGVTGVASGGTGQSSFATAGIVISPGGTAPLTTIPGAASATVGMAVTPTVTPAGLSADGFQIGPVTVATGGTNVPIHRSLHLMPATKIGAGTVGEMYGAYVDGPTIAGTSTTVANYTKTGTTGSIGLVVDTVAAPTGNIQEWRANGAAVATLSPIGTFAPTGMRGVTSFPAAPANGLNVYREDLGVWYRASTSGGTITTAITGTGAQTVTTTAAHNLSVGDLVTVGGNSNVAVTAVPSTTTFTASFGAAVAGSTAYTAVAWRQVGIASFTTAARPAAPPPDFRYTDLTDGNTYRWNGTAYIQLGRVVLVDYTATTNVFSNAALAGQAAFGAQTVTTAQANSEVEILIQAAVYAVSGNAGIDVWGVGSIVIDGTYYPIVSQLINTHLNMFGAAYMRVSNLTAGSHTISAGVSPIGWTSGFFCRPASFPTQEDYKLTIWETRR